jgi:hypothetical protein
MRMVFWLIGWCIDIPHVVEGDTAYLPRQRGVHLLIEKII